jgi:alkylhydroperoxidase/carboxymuconolactone decarboxylase family protein YurZ
MKSLPAAAGDLARKHPKLWKAYSALGEAASEAGPLDARSRRLVKLALAIGAQSEGAVHSHTRQAISEGLTAEEVKHAALLAVTTLGFPKAVAALSWIEDVTDPE